MADNRQLPINNHPFSGDSVVYVMSRDQRVQDNHVLLAAQDLAIAHNVPLYVLFVLHLQQSGSREHYDFMITGLQEVAASLQSHNILFVLRSGDTVEVVTDIVKELDCGALYFDFNPLKNVRKAIKKISSLVDCQVTVVDTHNIIPLWVASDKQEFAAHTMRRKIHQHLSTFLVAPALVQLHPSAPRHVGSMSFDEARAFINVIPNSGIIIGHKPGEKAAQIHLAKFLENSLTQYALRRNDIASDCQSGLSPYLHFGQISSLRVAIETMDHAKQPPLLCEINKLAQASGQPSILDGMNALFEEMIVRKELSDNFCFYNESYDSLAGAPEWGRATLAKHATDLRDFLYTTEQWEAAETHDDAWNAAQTQLLKSGKIHGYMRMYWAKKILEWSVSPKEALKTAIYLNDKYSVDGGDPNGYVGILWSIAGLHDRPWVERSVYGTTRYMNAAGLRRKFDLDTYIRKWS